MPAALPSRLPPAAPGRFKLPVPVPAPGAGVPESGRSQRAGRRARQVRRTVVVVAIFAVLVALGVIVRQTFDQPVREAIQQPPAEEADLPRHVGTIRLWPDRDGRCPAFRFDNDTGVMTPVGTVDCSESASPNRPISPTGRMDTIREGFRRR